MEIPWQSSSPCLSGYRVPLGSSSPVLHFGAGCLLHRKEQSVWSRDKSYISSSSRMLCSSDFLITHSSFSQQASLIWALMGWASGWLRAYLLILDGHRSDPCIPKSFAFPTSSSSCKSTNPHQEQSYWTWTEKLRNRPRKGSNDHRRSPMMGR